MKTLIRRHMMWRLILVYAVSLCPFYGFPGKNRLVGISTNFIDFSVSIFYSTMVLGFIYFNINLTGLRD